MRTDLRAHLRALSQATWDRLFRPGITYRTVTMRGVCGWCGESFLRPMETIEQFKHAPVLYCRKGHATKASAKRHSIATHAHLCRTPHKRTFLTEAVALAEAAANGDRQTLTAYQCKCRGWHLTKKAAGRARVR